MTVRKAGPDPEEERQWREGYAFGLRALAEQVACLGLDAHDPGAIPYFLSEADALDPKGNAMTDRHFTLPRAPEREMGGPGTVHHVHSAEHLAAASPTLAAERRLTAIRGQARFYPEGDAAWLLARYDALAGAARALVDSDTGPGLSAEWAALMALLPPEDPR